jgi:hypothetical protein
MSIDDRIRSLILRLKRGGFCIDVMQEESLQLKFSRLTIRISPSARRASIDIEWSHKSRHSILWSSIVHVRGPIGYHHFYFTNTALRDSLFAPVIIITDMIGHYSGRYDLGTVSGRGALSGISYIGI